MPKMWEISTLIITATIITTILLNNFVKWYHIIFQLLKIKISHNTKGNLGLNLFFIHWQNINLVQYLSLFNFSIGSFYPDFRQRVIPRVFSPNIIHLNSFLILGILIAWSNWIDSTASATIPATQERTKEQEDSTKHRNIWLIGIILIYMHTLWLFFLYLGDTMKEIQLVHIFRDHFHKH